MRTATKRLRVILDAKYENANLHKVMESQCQHLTMKKRNELLKLLHKFKEFFVGTLGTRKKDSLEFELKEDAKIICSRPYPVPKVHKEMFKNSLNVYFYYDSPRQQMIQNGEPYPLLNLNLNQTEYVF